VDSWASTSLTCLVSMARRRKLMWSGSGSVRVAGTAEHAKVVIGRGCAV
jgi:hypothetical protein